jgi:hypothetical protein
LIHLAMLLFSSASRTVRHQPLATALASKKFMLHRSKCGVGACSTGVKEKLCAAT